MFKRFTLIVLMTTVAMTAKAYTYYDGIEMGNFRYNLALATSSSEESKATLQGLSSAGASVTSLKIPGYVTYDGNRYRVANIATNAFQYKTSVASVELGYGVQKIGNNVFKGCESLSSILLPSSITEIGNYAFQSCTALLFVRVAGDVAPAIQDNTFDNSGTSKRVSTATYRGMNALKADSKWVAAFGASNIKCQSGIVTYDFVAGNLYYTIQNGIPYKFSGQNRSTCTIVGGNFTSYSTVTLNQNISNSDNNAPGSYHLYGVADSAFMNNSAITQVVNNNTTADRIGIRAFYGCTSLISSDVPVNTIGDYAFYNCTSLASATVASNLNNLEYLGNFAFGKCALTGEINIPATTKYIGYAPFYYCTSLEEITVDKNNTNYCSDYYILYNKAKTQLIQIPGSSWYAGSVQYTPKTLEQVLPYAAAGCNLEALYLPYGVTLIGQYAFLDCKKLKIVHLPSSATSVNANAFAGCDAINQVELNFMTPPATDYFPAVTNKSKVKLYMPYESYDTYANSSIWSQYNRQTGTYDHHQCWDLDHGVVRYTVLNDLTLKAVSIISGTRSIPSEILYAGKTYVPKEIGYRAGRNTSESTSIIGGSSITKIDDYAFADIRLRNSNFPFTNVETIGDYAFYNTPSLGGEIVNNDKMKTIGKFAFAGSGITKFEAPASLTSIGDFAFYNCQNLKEIFLYHHDSQETITCGRSFFGGNADNFKCWVDYRRLSDFVNTNKWDTSKIYPHIYLNSKYQSFSCIKPINFQGITGLTAYYVSEYNSSEKKAYLINTNNIAANNGCVVKGEVGEYYRLDYATSGTTSSWMVGTAEGAQTVNSDNTTSYFKVNPDMLVFNKITSNTTFNRGAAYLKVPTNQTGGATTINTNFDTSVEDVTTGDVNGDGKVNVSDVTALINMILGITPMDQTRADVNGDTKVNVSDVTALINIILGIH